MFPNIITTRIWTHMVDISAKSNTTIIITTHYIEEARKAHAIGLMRNGKILAEQNPQDLLQAHNETSLEQVFLKLCIEESSSDQLINGGLQHLEDGVKVSLSLFFQESRRPLLKT